jgi:glycolate oxidase FAD binding subunit
VSGYGPDMEMLLDAAACAPPAGAPGLGHWAAPNSIEQAADIMRAATDHRAKVLIWGGGTHQGHGHAVEADIGMSTGRLTQIVEWIPEDLTLVVEAGVKVAEVEATLAERGQTAVLPEVPGGATVGGTVAAGVSGWRRLRYGPTRDRILEAVMATGDGRVVRAGGRLVKNVTGYDIPRLLCGSYGSLGLIGSVCLKLWPIGARFASVPVTDPVAARRVAFRPLAIIETETGAAGYFAGTSQEIEAQAAALGAAPVDDPRWPRRLDSPWQVSIRVPAADTAEAVAWVRRVPGARFRAAHGVGEVAAGFVDLDEAWFGEARRWAEGRGGALVITHRPDGLDGGTDPWGTPPASLPLQKAVKAAFDPLSVCNPGRLPGRL